MEITQHYNESQVFANVARGDTAAFTLLYNRYRAPIYSTALSLTNNSSIAEEILQDTFLKVWLKREELTSLENFGGWLYRIAENLTYNALKKMLREKELALKAGLVYIPSVTHDAELILEEKEYQALLNRAIKRLPPRQQETYRLIKIQGLTREQAANAMKISGETVKWNLEHAMKSIRAYCIANIHT